MIIRRKPMFRGVAICVLAVICIIGVLSLYSNLLKRDLQDDTTRTLEEISFQSATIINNHVQHELELLHEISEKLSNNRNEFDVNSVLNDLTVTAQIHNFKTMGIMLESGKVYNTLGFETQIPEIKSEFSAVFTGKDLVTDRLKDKMEGEYVILYGTPIYLDTEVIAMLFATYVISDFQELVSIDTFNKNGYSYVVKRNGEAVVSSKHQTSFGYFDNIFNVIELANDSNTQACENLYSGMQSGETGKIIFNNKEDKYMQYMPLKINDWYLLSVVPVRVADESRNSIMLKTFAVCLFVILAALFAILYFIYIERKRKSEYEKLHDTDFITGGISYVKFISEGNTWLSQKTENTAFIVLELSNFDVLLEKYGKDKAEDIIRFTYKTLGIISRSSALYAHISEGKFVIMCRFQNKEDLIKRLNMIRDEISTPPGDSLNGIVLQCDIGIYVVEDSSVDIMRMNNLAQIAKKSIQCKNGDFYAFYSDFYKDTLLRNDQMLDEMVRALNNDEFVPYFQPKYNTATQTIIGAEALVRWIKADGSMVYPNDFIPLAENTRFIVEIDRMMFQKVCIKQRELIDSGITPVPISVNLSRKMFYDTRFIDDFLHILKKYDIAVNLIELEITERTLFTNEKAFKDIIKKLHDKGFKILVDDFGIGYSSLTMLKSSQIYAIKLDKSFIDDYDDVKCASIIADIILLAKDLNLPITAEGVETEAQYDFLLDMNCDSIQGYYFARPMDFSDFKSSMNDNK